MKSLVPPVIGGNAEAVYCGSVKSQLSCHFLNGHFIGKCFCSFLWGKGGIKIFFHMEVLSVGKLYKTTFKLSHTFFAHSNFFSISAASSAVFLLKLSINLTECALSFFAIILLLTKILKYYTIYSECTSSPSLFLKINEIFVTSDLSNVSSSPATFTISRTLTYPLTICNRKSTGQPSLK